MNKLMCSGIYISMYNSLIYNKDKDQRSVLTGDGKTYLKFILTIEQ